MAAGRPTKLTKELIHKARDYDFKNMNQAVPTIEGLALYINVNRETVREWAQLDTKLGIEFSAIVNKLLETQALELVNKGLTRFFEPRIANMMLSKHGYIEKKEQDINHSGNVQFVNDVPRPDGRSS